MIAKRGSLAVWLAQSKAQLGDVLRIKRRSSLDDPVDTSPCEAADYRRYIHAVNSKHVEA